MSTPIPSPVNLKPIRDRLDTVEADIPAIGERVAQVEGKIPTISTKVDRLVAAVINVWDHGAVGDGIADDTAKLQAALDAAAEVGGATVYVPHGTYLLTNYLQISSHTHLRLEPSVVVMRGSNTNAMIVNKSDGTTGGYDASRNITIEGGTWDANATKFPTQCCVIAFGHSSDVEVRNLTVRDVFEWHHIEFNSTQRGRVVNCNFLDFVVGSRNSEAIQLDVSGGGFPWFGPVDSTPCRDITIDRCVFLRQSRGVGTHTTVPGVWQENITITNCLFESCDLNGVYAMNWDRVHISGCTFRNCGAEAISGMRSKRVRVTGCEFSVCRLGVLFQTDAATTCEQITVDGNVFENIGLGQSVSSVRVIYFLGITGQWNMRDVVASNNVVRNSSQHGITADHCRGVVISGNRVAKLTSTANPFGIAVFGCRDATVTGNSVEEVNNVGIYIHSTENATICGNAIRRIGSGGIVTTSGAKCVGISGNTVAEALLPETFHNGITIGGSHITASNNTVMDCGFDGIRLTNATDCVVSGNLCVNNGTRIGGGGAGIHLTTSDRNLIQANVVRMGTVQLYGVWVQSGSDNMVIGNDMLGGGKTTNYVDNATGTVTAAGNRT